MTDFFLTCPDPRSKLIVASVNVDGLWGTGRKLNPFQFVIEFQLKIILSPSCAYVIVLITFILTRGARDFTN